MKSKTVLVFLLIGSIFLFSDVVNAKECFVINNNDICITSEEYNNLINSGFDDFEIMNMSNDIFNSNKDLLGHVASVTTKYTLDTYYHQGDKVYTTTREVSEEEYNSIKPMCNLVTSKGTRTVANGFTETVGKRMDTTIIEYTNNLRYKVDVRWKNIPIVRSYDIIGIGLDYDDVYVSGNKTFSQTYCVTAMTCTSSSTANIRTQTGGAGATYKLPEGSYVHMASYFYYDVSKKISGTLTSTHAYGDYAHATETVSEYAATYYYSVGFGGLNLYSSIAPSYDYINCAQADWYGTWY